jgi:putative hemolysin
MSKGRGMPFSIATEVVIIFMLILVNGILAMSEMALVSAQKTRLRQLASKGVKDAHAALAIANSPDDFLSTVQCGITLVAIFAGVFGGATIAEELAEYIKSIATLALYADAIALGLVIAVITYFSLIIGELVPKRLALHAPEKIACLVAVPMQFLSRVGKPVIALLSGSTNFVLRIIGVKERADLSVTEADIQVLLEQATHAGVFEEAEQEMLSSVMRLGDRKVNSIMTHRNDVVWVDVNMSKEGLIELLDASQHTRFLIAEESLDHVLGIVESRTIMRRCIHEQPIELRELIVQPAYIPESFTVLDLLERLRDTKQHLAVVMDEYGGTQGLVTREDILEAIVGELPAHGKLPKWEARQREDGSWLLDGQIPLDEFKSIFHMDKLSSDEPAEYHTLAGFILFQLGRIPEAGERFESQGLRFEVVDMDRHRIDKVIVNRTTM